MSFALYTQALANHDNRDVMVQLTDANKNLAEADNILTEKM